MGIGMQLLDQRRIALGGVARPAVPAVQPAHERASIVPDTKREHHAAPQRLAHALQPAQPVERAARVGAVVGRDGVHGLAVHGHDGVLDDMAVLHVQPANLDQRAGGGVVLGVELRDNGHGLGGVDFEVVAVEVVRAQRVRVEPAAGLVAHAVRLALGTAALVQLRDVARVRRVARGPRVRLPDVHLVAARAGALDVGFAVDPGDIETLCVAIASSPRGARGIELATATIALHLGEVEGAVHAAHQRRHVDVERELLVEQLQHLVVLAVLGEEVHAWRHGLGCVAVAKVLVQGHTAALGLHAVVGIVGDALDDAIGGAGLLIRAEVRVRAAASRAGGLAALLVDPVRCGVDDDRRVLLDAAVAIATLPCREFGVYFGGFPDGLACH